MNVISIIQSKFTQENTNSTFKFQKIYIFFKINMYFAIVKYPETLLI